MVRTLLGLAAVMACIPGPAQSAAAPLIRNGDFNESRFYQAESPGYFRAFVPSHWDIAPFSNDTETAGGDFLQNSLRVDPDRIYLAPGSRDDNLALAIYNRASLQQSFHIDSEGEYALSWRAAGPHGGGSYNPENFALSPQARGLRYAVLVDGIPQSQPFATHLRQGYTFQQLTLLLGKGSHSIGFAGLDMGEIERFGGANQYVRQYYTHIAVLDDVAVSPVPEPQTWALWMLGLGGVIAGRWRRQGT